MASTTAIGWADQTSNPIRVKDTETGELSGHWCRKSAPECANCYAERLNLGTFFGWASGLPYTGAPPPLDLDRQELARWKRRRAQKTVFIGSMTDVFGEWISPAWHLKILQAAYEAHKQVSQFLTKWSSVALGSITRWLDEVGISELPAYMMMGVSCGHPQSLPKIDQLCAIPAATRFLSCEPLIGDVSLPVVTAAALGAPLGPEQGMSFPSSYIGTALGHIHWVIVGCESGDGARGHEDYQRRAWAIIQQCQAYGVPCFHKQCAICKGGKWVVSTNPAEWPKHLRVQEMPEIEVPS